MAWARTAYQLSERRASRRWAWRARAIQYQSGRPSQAPLRSRLRELGAVRIRYGYRCLHVLLRREGWRVNHKRVLTILDAYTRECLGLVAQARFTGGDVAEHLGRIAATRQVPATIGVDNVLSARGGPGRRAQHP